MKEKIKEYYFTSLVQNLDLECAVECASPQTSLNFTWTKADTNEFLFNQTIRNGEPLKSNYTYTIRASSFDSVYELLCSASNGIDLAARKDESITRIRISYKKETG